MKRTIAAAIRASDSHNSGMSSHAFMQSHAVARLFVLVVVLGTLATGFALLNVIGVFAMGWSTPCAMISITTNGFLAVLSAALLHAIKHERFSPRTLINLGLIYEICFAFTISLSEVVIPRSHGLLPDGLSVTAVLIILFPLFVPASLSKTLITALAAATTGPLAALISITVSDRVLGPEEHLFWSYSANYFVVMLAMVPTAIMRRMAHEVSRAERLGSYQLVELIGHGGMGEVWQAQHHTLRRPAAIKLIRPETLGARDEEGVAVLLKRFEREAQATAELHSQHSIQLYDFGVTNEGTFFYVMEMLKGFDLESMIQRFGPMPPERVVHLLLQVCESLWDAHQSCLVHRDIKPANIYVCRYGHQVDFIKVLDFGLVKYRRHNTDVRLTDVDATTGTPSYMAPELALNSHTVDGRADLYALGCVAYWMLTGTLVFEHANAMKMIVAHIQETPAPPSARTTQAIPQRLEEIILWCLAKDPADRPQSARELSLALRELAATMPVWGEDIAQQWWSNNTDVPASCGTIPAPEKTVSMERIRAIH